jgi:hypothetical protein
MSGQFLQLAEAVRVLGPPARGRRRVKIIERGKKWVMYLVTTEGRVELGYVDWIKRYDMTPYVGSKTYMVINLRAGCAVYYQADIYEAYKLTERDIAGLVTIRSVKDLWDFIWRRIKDGGEPCDRSPLFL